MSNEPTESLCASQIETSEDRLWFAYRVVQDELLRGPRGHDALPVSLHFLLDFIRHNSHRRRMAEYLDQPYLRAPVI